MASGGVKSPVWETIGSATGTTPVSIPAYCDELLVYAVFGGDQRYGFSFYAIRNHPILPSNLIGGSYISPADAHTCVINIDWESNKVALVDWFWAGTNYAATSSITVYGK